MEGEFTGDRMLVLLAGNAAIGCVLLVVLVTAGKRSFFYAALIGASLAFMVEPQLSLLLGAKTWPGGPLAIVLLGTIAAIIVALVVRSILKNAGGIWEALAHVRDGAPDILVPERWRSAGDGSLTSVRDRAKRWFVAISAATGAVVGSIAGLDFFQQALVDTFTTRNILFAFLVTGVSFFLIGPFQNYVFDLGAGNTQKEDPAQEMAALFERMVDWRWTMRILIVLVTMIQISLLSSCIETAMVEGDREIVLRILLMGAAPAIVSYYWCAALQLAPARDGAQMYEANLAAGAALNYGIAFALTFIFLLQEVMDAHEPGAVGFPLAFGLFMSPVFAIALAYVFSFVTIMPYAFLGWKALTRHTGRFAMALLAVAMVLAAFLHQFLVSVPLLFLVDWRELASAFLDVSFIGHIGGWMVGLMASGFPGIVRARGNAPAVETTHATP